MTDWRPQIVRDGTSLHEGLVATLKADIGSGALAPGMRLPTHRELAHALGIGIGSVTRAYALAAQRGLIEARVGRGSFVAQPALSGRSCADATGPVDLARNVPPTAPAERRFSEALARLRRRADLLEHVDYAPAFGFSQHRRMLARWIQRTARFEDLNPERLILCGGAQEAMSLAFAAIARPGDTIMTEAATFYGMKNLAEHAGYALKGLAMDEQGLTPKSLDEAAAAGARVLYAMPTLQNPTGRTMSAARRAEIARILRKRDVWLVEDDIYSIFAGDPHPAPLSSLVPERTFYINGLSKAVAPGLRVGCLHTPNEDLMDRLASIVRARCYTPGMMGCLVAAEWLESGIADEIVRDVRAEVRARTRLTKEVLRPFLDPGTSDECMHAWMPMPELLAERLAGRLLKQGIEVTPPSAPIVDSKLISGVRLCIAGVRDQQAFAQSLRTIASSFTDKARDQGVV